MRKEITTNTSEIQSSIRECIENLCAKKRTFRRNA
jgi:hypothetical protein